MSDGRQISICDQTGSDSDHRQIIICPEGADPNRQITICPDDCADPPELFISGADGLDSTTDYEQYSASGGVTPYSWSFDGGDIDSSGLITSITSCGGSQNGGAMGSVTVTDACGQTASIAVRLPGGSWAGQDSWESTCYRALSSTFVRRETEISGDTKYLISFQYSGGQSYPYSAPYCVASVCGACESVMGWDCQNNITFYDYFSLSAGSTTTYYCTIYPSRANVYKWTCA